MRNRREMERNMQNYSNFDMNRVMPRPPPEMMQFYYGQPPLIGIGFPTQPPMHFIDMPHPMEQLMMMNHHIAIQKNQRQHQLQNVAHNQIKFINGKSQTIMSKSKEKRPLNGKTIQKQKSCFLQPSKISNCAKIMLLLDKTILLIHNLQKQNVLHNEPILKKDKKVLKRQTKNSKQTQIKIQHQSPVDNLLQEIEENIQKIIAEAKQIDIDGLLNCNYSQYLSYIKHELESMISPEKQQPKTTNIRFSKSNKLKNKATSQQKQPVIVNNESKKPLDKIITQIDTELDTFTTNVLDRLKQWKSLKKIKRNCQKLDKKLQELKNVEQQF